MLINKELLLKKISEGLPGSKAQQLMAPEMRIATAGRKDCKVAGVLLLLYPDKEEHRIVFMKRNEYDGHHSGQISFPGGMHEACDRSLQDTAIREAQEETGVQASDIEILASLTPLHIPVSNICVHPFLGWMDRKPDFQPDPNEVQYLVCAGIKDLKEPGNIKISELIREDLSFSFPYYAVEGEQIWGATAMILSEFMALIDY